MIILGFDTSTTLCSIGLVRNTEVIDSAVIETSESHSVHLMQMIDQLLHSNRIKTADIKLVSVGCGPGSFTGIRIAVSTAKTMALALNIPCVGINTLDAMAHCISGQGDILCPMIDARKQQIYWRIYEMKDGQPVQGSSVNLCAVEEIFSQCDAGTIFCGTGALVYEDQIRLNYGENARIVPIKNLFSLGSKIAELGQISYEQGIVTDPSRLVPIYVRKPDAEINWEKGNRKNGENIK
jgi:tRNA threonylcarbamoyladenosine biosynthesis protein TsaB